MQEENLRLRGLRVGALPILNRFIERMGLEEELTLALKNPGYADALLALNQEHLGRAQRALCSWRMGRTLRCGIGRAGQDRRRQARTCSRSAVCRGSRHLADTHRTGRHERLRSQDGADP